jgi:hypothetical protein
MPANRHHYTHLGSWHTGHCCKGHARGGGSRQLVAAKAAKGMLCPAGNDLLMMRMMISFADVF